MKKILKYFLFGIVLCLGLVAFSFNDNVISFICHAVNTETCKVNFYSSDGETLLFSRDVEKGTTLNEIKSHNLIPMYTDKTVSSRGLVFSYDHITQVYSVTGTCNETNEGRIFSLDEELNYFVGSTWCDVIYLMPEHDGQTSVSVCFATGSLYTDNLQFSTAWGVMETFDHNVTWGSIRFYTIKNNIYNLSFRLFVREGAYFNTNTPYEYTFDNFNTFISEQFLYSAGVTDYSTDVSWSISPNSDSKFSFDSPINHDYNFYGFIDNGITYNYNGNVDARLSEIGDYAIKDIVSFNIDGYYLLEIDFNSSSTFEFNFNHNDITSIISNFEYSSWKSFLFNSLESYCDLNFFVLSDNGSVTLGNYPGAQWKLSCSGNSKLYLSNLYFSYGNSYDTFTLSSNDYSKSSNYLFDTNLGGLVDMNSDTNFSYQLIYDDCIWLTHNSDFYVSYNILSRVLNGFDFSSNRITFINPQLDDDVYYFSTDIPEVVDFRIYNNNAGSSYSFYNLSNNFNNFAYYYIYKPSSYDFSYNINNYYFVIDKPSYRVNNSLCIYNFDYYNTLSGVSSLTYELQKGVDYYDVTYVGSVPNSKFLYFDCPEIDNTIFNRYVFLYLSFSNSKIDLIKDNQYLSYSVGFDFNFIYYNQPLITSNGVYPYSFDVPKYKDASITFSLVPPQFVIPWNAIFYNAVVFLCFYMPLISDINNAIGLNYFIGALLNVTDIIFNSSFGNFIFACFAFIILFALMRSLFPFVYKIGKRRYLNA